MKAPKVQAEALQGKSQGIEARDDRRHGRYTPMESFHDFSALPLEIRLQVWQAVLRTPRIITISKTWEVQSWGTWSRESRAKPALLNVNFESRQESLRHYGRNFKDSWSDAYDVDFPGFIDPRLCSCGIFLNMDFDTIKMSGAEFQSTNIHDKRLIKRLELDLFPCSIWKSMFQECHALRELTIIAGWCKSSVQDDDWRDPQDAIDTIIGYFETEVSITISIICGGTGELLARSQNRGRGGEILKE